MCISLPKAISNPDIQPVPFKGKAGHDSLRIRVKPQTYLNDRLVTRPSTHARQSISKPVAQLKKILTLPSKIVSAGLTLEGSSYKRLESKGSSKGAQEGIPDRNCKPESCQKETKLQYAQTKSGAGNSLSLTHEWVFLPFSRRGCTAAILPTYSKITW